MLWSAEGRTARSHGSISLQTAVGATLEAASTSAEAPATYGRGDWTRAFGSSLKCFERCIGPTRRECLGNWLARATRQNVVLDRGWCGRAVPRFAKVHLRKARHGVGTEFGKEVGCYYTRGFSETREARPLASRAASGQRHHMLCICQKGPAGAALCFSRGVQWPLNMAVG